LGLIGATGGHALTITRIYAISVRKKFIMSVLFIIFIGNMASTIFAIPNTSCSSHGGATVKQLGIIIELRALLFKTF